MLFLLGIVCVVVFMTLAMVAAWAAWMRAKRFEAMPIVAAGAGLQFAEFDPFNSAAVPFPLFREGDGRRIQNVMWREAPSHPRVFEYGYFTLHHDQQGNSYQRWQWFACALAQHNGRWPELRITRERVLDRAAQTLGLPDIELESEEFNRLFLVQCENPKFATDLLDPQMMEFVLGTQGLIDIRTKGRFVLLTTSQLQAEAMVGLLGVAEGFVQRVPSMVWQLYGRFPDGLGTEDMPVPQVGLHHPAEERPFTFTPQPDLRGQGDAWDPTPGVEHDLDGNPVAAREERPWGDR